MIVRRQLLTFALVAVSAALQSTSAQERARADGPRGTYVRVGGRGETAADAVLYEPAGAPSRIALLFAHPGESNFNHAAGREMARRGYRILMINHADDVSPADAYAPSTSAALKYLRGLAGVDKVVIITHSGGGHHMAFYENAAENGPKACAGPEKIYPCRSERVTGLEKADGLVLLDPTLGAFHQMSSIDPAVDSASPKLRKAELDMFDSRNGYDAAGRRAQYQPEFARKFYSAQAVRSAALIEQARLRLAAIEKGAGAYKDDEPFVVPGMGISATGARLYQPDVRIVASTRAPHVVLKADGSRTTEIARSIRPPSGARPDEALGTLAVMTQNSTVRQFLAQSAIRTEPTFAFTENDIVGVDWKSAMNSTPGNAEGITVPTLVMSMTCHYLMVPDEIIFDHLAAKDKQLVMVEGATHGFGPCRPEFGDTTARTFDYVDSWLKQSGRFAPAASHQ
jgi:pimeloyl-ACP methyl ester carboxylesterase